MVSTTSRPTPRWYQQAIIYQAHVRAFHDSDDDGIGDFRGLAEKLPYLQDLGITALWLLPFYPSPLKDDGYDIADYGSVNPIYGTLDDFRHFLDAAHERGLRVITELVVNHTSDQHAWFQRARRAPAGSPERDYYVWSDDPLRYREARIIFRDFEASNWTWDPVANAYYWHRFYAHQPDLNFDNPRVHEELQQVLDFWLGLGVDGLRLDAVPYLYEREGTNCENLPETHAYLKRLREYVDSHYEDRMLLAEANQWPEDAVAYFGSGRGDECHMAFHFPLMPRLFMAVRMEDRVPVLDILEQTPPIPETCQWAVFLRNHDELTLEMVTEEERDYMYRVYAADVRARINLGIRRRLAPLVENDRRRVELLNVLLLSMPGTPVIYYGDEIGMGDNIYLGDRNGVRTPMHWSPDRNAGFSRANPQRLYLPIILDPEYHYEANNVEAQQRNPTSLLWWMRRLLGLRQRWPVLGGGRLRFLEPENRKVLAFLREDDTQRVLVVANLSRFAQPVELDLGEFQGQSPVDLFGHTRFPAIEAGPYRLTINPHGYFWFSLQALGGAEAEAAAAPQTLAELPVLAVDRDWRALVRERGVARLEAVLAGFLPQRRWFGGKAREIKSISVIEATALPCDGDTALLTLLQIEFVQGEADVYAVPLAAAWGADAERLLAELPAGAIARLESASSGSGLLYDAALSPGFARAVLQAIGEGRRFTGWRGDILAVATDVYPGLAQGTAAELEPSVSRAEQSNTSVRYGDRLILKFLRRPDVGLNPDLEIGRFLTARRFPHVPPVAGSLEYRSRTGEWRTLGILSAFVSSAVDGWEYTLDALARYFERVTSRPDADRVPVIPSATPLELARAPLPAELAADIGTYLESARALATRTAELHLTLGASEERDFAPEPFSPHYQRSLYQSMRNLAVETFQLLRRQRGRAPRELREGVESLLGLEGRLIERYRDIYRTGMGGMRIRCHGDYHLGQVLHTGKDFVILDFEGEPARSIGARRLRRSPLSDVAGMLRSFHYASHAALWQQRERGLNTPENQARSAAWAAYWRHWVSACFIAEYLRTMDGGPLLPSDLDQLKTLLDCYWLDKTVYEIAYELNNRPAWFRVPLEGMLEMLS